MRAGVAAAGDFTASISLAPAMNGTPRQASASTTPA